MSTNQHLALVLPEPDPATRRMGSVNLPTLLFVAFVHGAESVARDSLRRFDEALRARYNKACESGDEQRAAIFHWLRENSLYAQEAITLALDGDSGQRHLQPEQSNRVLTLLRTEHDRKSADPLVSATRAAQHLAAAPSHFTTPSTDPLVYLLESVRLAHGVGEAPGQEDVCNQCVGLDAMLGDLDPVCPLCRAVSKRALFAEVHSFGLLFRPKITHAVLIRIIIEACEPGATMDSVRLLA